MEQQNVEGRLARIEATLDGLLRQREADAHAQRERHEQNRHAYEDSRHQLESIERRSERIEKQVTATNGRVTTAESDLRTAEADLRNAQGDIETLFQKTKGMLTIGNARLFVTVVVGTVVATAAVIFWVLKVTGKL